MLRTFLKNHFGLVCFLASIFSATETSAVENAITNQAPVASSVNSATLTNTSASIFLVASDAEYDNLTYIIVSQPSNGTIVTSGANVIYTPNTGFTGTDTFTFKANNGFLDSNVETVTISVFNSYLNQPVQIGQDLVGENSSDLSGNSISFNEDRTIMAIGAKNYANNKGVVKVYKNINGTWSIMGSAIVGSAINMYHGFSIDLSSNGMRLAVGAPGYNNEKGMVRIYEYANGAWTQMGSDLTINNDSARFGCSVSFTADAEKLAIGAWGYNNRRGAVRVYQYNNNMWEYLYDTIGNYLQSDDYGKAIAFSSDGSRALIGAPNYFSGKGFARSVISPSSMSGIGFNYVEMFYATNSENFGSSVTISSNGKTFAIGGIGYSNSKGVVRIYKIIGNSDVILVNTFTGQSAGDLFGSSISISSDGKALAIGAPGANSNNGKVSLYRFENNQWSASGTQFIGQNGEKLGTAVELSSDGTAVAVGAVAYNNDKGVVRVYDLKNSVPEATADTFLVETNSSNNFIDVLANDSDPDDDEITLVDVSTSGTGSVSITNEGTINYTPAPNFEGIETISYTITDGVHSNTNTLTITVNGSMILVFDTSLETSGYVRLLFYGDTNVTVDWGDNTSENFNDAGIKSHFYSEDGEYTVKITGSLDGYGTHEIFSNNKKLTKVLSFGNLGLESLSSAFKNAENLIVAPNSLPATVTDINYMFQGATSFNQNINSWNVVNVNTMSGMFSYATSFNQDLNGWNVSNVEYMDNMFQGAISFNQDLSSWNVGNVKNMALMFEGATSFNQDLSSWNVSSVESMTWMFDEVTLSTANYDAILTGWSQLTLKQNVGFSAGNSKYSSCNSAARNILTDTFGWYISDGGPEADTTPPIAIAQDITVVLNDNGQATITAADIDNGSYDNCGTIALSIDIDSFSSTYSGLPTTVTLTVTDEGNNTATATAAVTVIDPMILVFDTTLGNGTEVTLPFDGLTNITVDWGDNTTSSYTTQGIKNHTYSMEGTYTVKILGELWGFGSPSTSVPNIEKLTKVISFGNLGIESIVYGFANAENLTVVPNVLPSSLKSISYMFIGATSFNHNISDWNLSNVEYIEGLFMDATSFNQDISNWDISNVDSFYAMFSGATSFNQDLSGWNVSNVQDMEAMFAGATSFDQNIGSWNVSNVSDMNNMFGGVTLSTANYDAILTSWSQLTLQEDVIFSGGNSKHSCNLEARDDLTDTFGWTIYDGGPEVDTTVPIAIAQDITVELDENGQATITAADIDNGSYDSCSTVTLSIDTATFTSANIGTPTTVTLTVTDEANNTTTATALVTTVNVVPIAVADSATVTEDAALTSVNVLANDTDPNNDELELRAVTTAGTGLVAVNTDGVSINYTPAGNFNGTEVVTYTVTDGVYEVTGTLTITVTPVNDAPTIIDEHTATLKNTAVEIHLFANDYENDNFQYTIVTQPSNGTITLTGDKVIFTPNANYIGTDSFTYKVNDGNLDSQMRSIFILVFDSYLSEPEQIGNSINAFSPNDNLGSSVSMSSDGKTFVVGAPGSNATGQVKVYRYNGTNWALLGSVINGEATGDKFGGSVSISSDGNTVLVGAEKHDGDGVFTDDGQAKVFRFIDNDWVQQGNDLSKENAFSFGKYVSISADGLTAAIVGNYLGVQTVFIFKNIGNSWQSKGSVSFSDGFSFENVFSLSADGNTFSLGLPFNSELGNKYGKVQVFHYDGISWNQLGNAIYGSNVHELLGASTSLSANGKILAIGALATSIIGGNIKVYSLSSNNNWVQIGNNILGTTPSDAFGLSVSLSSDGYTLVGGAYTQTTEYVKAYRFINSEWQIIGGAIQGIEQNENLGYGISLSGNGLNFVVGAPKYNENSGHARVYRIVDNLPVANTDVATVLEDAALTAINVLANDTDADGDELELATVTTAGTGNVELNSDGVSINYTPAANFNGTEVVTYTISNGTTSVTGTLNITVTPVNDIPVAEADTATIEANTVLTSINVLANDTDVDNDELELTAVTTAGLGVVTINTDDNSIDYTPATNFSGTEVITYTVSDGDVLVTGTLTITVINPMILVFDTSLGGATNTIITLAFNGATNVTVDWGDNTTNNYTNGGEKNHTYTNPGEYTVKITGELFGYGQSPVTESFSSVSNIVKLTEVLSFGSLGIESLFKAFENAENLTVAPTVLPNTVTDLGFMFSGANSFNQDISSWDVSNIEYMDGMFSEATSFNQDLSSWNVANVQYMEEMFDGVTLSTANYDAILNGWSQLTLKQNVNFSAGDSKYSSCNLEVRDYLINYYNWTITDGGPETDSTAPIAIAQDITVLLDQNGQATITAADINNGSYDNCGTITLSIDTATFTAANVGTPTTVTLTVTDEANNTATATANVTVLDPMILVFDTSLGNTNDTSITLAFHGATNVTVDWGDNTINNYTNDGQKNHTYTNPGEYTVKITGELYGYGKPNDIVPNIEKLTKVLSFGNLGIESFFNGFADAVNLTVAPNFLPTTVTNLGFMFAGATSFNQDIGSWDVSNVDYMSGMFVGATSFNQDLSSWNVSNVVYMSVMFSWATSFNQDISGWNVSNVVNMVGMFDHATSFNQDLSGWEVGNVESMYGMFYSATSFNQNIGGWDVSSVQDMAHMFSGATSFNQNIGSWNVSNVSFLDGMFYEVTLSTANYDAILNGWSQLSLQDYVVFNAGNSRYSSCNSAGRDTLTGIYNWTITDGGPETDSTAPIAIAQDITVVLDQNGQATITAADIDNGSYDNCETVTLSIDTTTFTAANVGTPTTVTLTVTDGANNTATATANVTVTEFNEPPVAVDDVFTITEDSEQVSINVISNDTDSNQNDVLELTTVTTAGLGTVAVNADGVSVNYTPAVNYNGTEVVTYTVSDGDALVSGTLTVTVTSVNDTPTAVADTATVIEDAALTAINVLANDIDIDTDELELTAVATAGSGTVVVNSDGVSVNYTPAVNFNGTEVVTYTVSDGVASSTGTLTITVTPVNDAPITVADTATVVEDTSLTTINVLVNDTDADNDAIQLTAVSTVGTGTVILSANDASIDYTPAANFNGTEIVTYTIIAGNDTVTGTLTITVTPVNDVPVANADTNTVIEDATLTIINVLANDTDADNDELELTAVATAGSGTVAVNSDGVSVNYTPATNFNGTEVVTYTVSDGDASSTGTLTITVTPINDAPIAVADVFSVEENSTATALSVLANDTDVDGNTLSITTVTTAGGGSVSINSTNTEIIYTPLTDFVGTEVLSYTITDTEFTSNNTVTVTVTEFNEPPVAVSDVFTVVEDSEQVSINVIANDTDLNQNDVLFLTEVSTSGTGNVMLNPNNLSVDYTPAPNFYGTEVVTYTVTDGVLNDQTGTLTITVTPINDAPFANSDNFMIEKNSGLNSLNVLLNDFDPDGDSLVITEITNTNGIGIATINTNGTAIEFTSPTDFTGIVEIYYTISDNEFEDLAGYVLIEVVEPSLDVIWSSQNWSNNNGPSITQNAFINDNLTLTDNLSCNDLTISPEMTLIVPPNVILNVAGQLMNEGTIIFKSDATGTGIFGVYNQPEVQGQGIVKVEQYVGPKRAWRMLTSPLKGFEYISVYDNWQNGGQEIAGSGMNLFSASGGNGLHAGGSAFSIKKYPTSGTATAWIDVTDTFSEPLFDPIKNNSFVVFTTGPYTTAATNINTGSAETIYSASGNLITGDIIYDNLPTDVHSFIGNPYVSPIDPAALFADNTAFTKLWVWDPSLSTVGGYLAYDLTTGWSNTSESYSNTSGSKTMLQSGQAFFVKPATVSTLIIKETHKTSVVDNGVFFKTSSSSVEQIRAVLSKEVNGTIQNEDAAVVTLYTDGDNAVTVLDAEKMTKGGENISILTNQNHLTVEHRATAQMQDEVQFYLYGMNNISVYNLKVYTKDYAGLQPYLWDTLNDTYHIIPTDDSAYNHSFTILDPNAEKERFRVVFDATLSTTINQLDQISIYPNPVNNGKLTIALPNSLTDVNYRIVNMLGQTIKQGLLNSGVNQLEINAAIGVYNVIINSNGQSTTKKILIK